MSDAALKEKILDGTRNCIAVSGDGTWKTREHTSLVDVCTLIRAECGKVLDIEVMSSFFKVCDSFKGPKFGPKYSVFLAKHQPFCKKNHNGSAGPMELEKHNGTNAGPSAHDPSQNFPELYAFSSFYIEWYFWIIILVICCTIIALALLCMICCRKPYKTAVVRLSEEIPSHFPGTGKLFSYRKCHRLLYNNSPI
ncbi:uncharacterized protein TNIN_291831 [Trichonephila inaurata madagascariensis]|uniref:Mutator-like transposase domain-containing protein n=1 Tax=Trichonephila inaurata madagascariensis TaxID=2747483 RepID=A0A8X6YQD3_9ARAC|nr:uncharacterized protein TNIN_291831 [Trichonephila inaurata madagascariensis]